MVDPNFKRSVVLLCDHTKAEGTVGFVLNKNLGLQINELIIVVVLFIQIASTIFIMLVMF